MSLCCSVIGIHGLGGHTLETWKAGEKVWLRDLLPWSFEKARVFSFGYDSAHAFLQTSLKTQDTAILLLESIRRLRRQHGDEDNVGSSTLKLPSMVEADKRTEENHICLPQPRWDCVQAGRVDAPGQLDSAHIWIQQAFNIAFEPQSRYHSLSKSVTGVVFLGSPHISHQFDDDAGSRAQWVKTLDKLAAAAVVRTSQQDRRLTDYSGLKSICSLFDERGMHLKIFSFYELRKLQLADSLVRLHPFHFSLRRQSANKCTH